VSVHALRPGALVVNVGRPELVDTAALLAAVRAGRVRGYGVDSVVLAPDAPAMDRGLLAEGRVLQTGHSAWWREEALRRGAAMFERAILAAARGRPIDVVDTGVPALEQWSG
jgi:phosphoglycerate dehydrogenase-like enzyme